MKKRINIFIAALFCITVFWGTFTAQAKSYTVSKSGGILKTAANMKNYTARNAGTVSSQNSSSALDSSGTDDAVNSGTDGSAHIQAGDASDISSFGSDNETSGYVSMAQRNSSLVRSVKNTGAIKAAAGHFPVVWILIIAAAALVAVVIIRNATKRKSSKRIPQNYEEFIDINTRLTLSVDENSEVVDGFNKRRFVKYLPVLQRFVELIREDGANGKKDNGAAAAYYSANQHALEQLRTCSRCQCLNCIKSCSIDLCDSCEGVGPYISKCDSSSLVVHKYDDNYIVLKNRETGNIEKYKRLAIVDDIHRNKQFIVYSKGNSDGNFDIALYHPPLTYIEDLIPVNSVEDKNFVTDAYVSQS